MMDICSYFIFACRGSVVVQCERRSGKTMTAIIALINKVNIEKMYPQVLHSYSYYYK